MSITLDDNLLYFAQYNSLKFVFKTNEKEIFSQRTKQILESLSNPFEFLCTCLAKDEEISARKVSPFLYEFISEITKFVTDKNKLRVLLTPAIQLQGFNIFKTVKCPVIQNELINCFLLSSAPELVTPLLRTELHNRNPNSRIIDMAVKLKVEDKFAIYDMVIPLFLKDKIGEVEKLLSPSPSLQREFLNILDKIVGNEIQICDLLEKCNVKEMKGVKSPKLIYKLGIRLMKKYNIKSSTCPHIMHRHKLSSLRYLFPKHYIENELSLDSLVLFAKEISEGSSSLKVQVLDLFIEYLDCYSGLKFLEDQKLPDKNIPSQISILLEDKNEMESEKLRHIQQRQFKKLKPENFYPFSLPLESIIEIKNIEDFNKALCDLNSCLVIGIDTEWKPTLMYDKEEELMLIQIATPNTVYLFDMFCLQSLLQPDNWDELGKIFSNPDITKLAYSFAGDTKCLGGFSSKLKEHMKKISNLIDLNETKKLLIDYYPEFFSFSSKKANDHKGLSEMVFLCFGKPLDKMEQCSYWSIRPLSQNQIVYAALDAFCLLDLYNYLNRKTIELNYSDWKTLKPDASKAVAVNKNKTKKNSTNKYKQRAGKALYKQPQICAYNFKVVCDSMLQGLGKLLRSCNIDTIILTSLDYHEKCVELYEKEDRVILTRGNVFHSIRKHIPASRILSIKSDNVKMQLEEVTRHFRVIISSEDIFARCVECNCGSFLTVDPKVLSKTKAFRPRPGVDVTPRWVPVDQGKCLVNVHEGVTDKGLKLQLEKVPFGVLNKVPSVYVCEQCGKCYWDGSHMEKVIGSIRHLITSAVPSTPVPPPPPSAASDHK